MSVDSVWPRGMPAVGQHAERSRAVTADDIRRFTEISGDENPLHYDEARRGSRPPCLSEVSAAFGAAPRAR